MSEQRRARLHLEISRAASKLFWEQGVAATTGEQIADAVGLSVRTLWRHVRNKESCAEPIVAHSWTWCLTVLRRWPAELSLEEHLVAERARYQPGPEEAADNLAAARMIVLSATEPAIRGAWLLACEQFERDLLPVVAGRMRRPADDPDLRVHAAAVAAVVRVISEEVLADVLAGADRARMDDPYPRMARAVGAATGFAIGDPVDD
ncbi:TetR/AcrR family transcriptional regulator [Kribbella sp. DT2]|uniref:TetR/AcrR family transcriptional regulator n=1 Tax=Kribbella sp. DT2 TaxID=3393427 RepID=UPI003CE873B2